MRGCILPSGNAAEFPKLDAEMKRRGINPLVRTHQGGARTYLFLDEQIKLLPTDEKGPYFGDDNSGHSIYEIDDAMHLYRPLFSAVRRPPDISNRVTVFDLDDGSAVIVRGMLEKDHCFTNESRGSFNITIARQWSDANLPVVPVVIDVLDTLKHLQANIDLDEVRLEAIARQSFDEVLRDTVLLYVLLPNGQHMLIDGHHRLAFLSMCCARAGLLSLHASARILTQEIAEHFKVRYVERTAYGVERTITADELLTRISGIYTTPDGDGSIRIDPRKRHHTGERR